MAWVGDFVLKIAAQLFKQFVVVFFEEWLLDISQRAQCTAKQGLTYHIGHDILESNDSAHFSLLFLLSLLIFLILHLFLNCILIGSFLLILHLLLVIFFLNGHGVHHLLDTFEVLFTPFLNILNESSLEGNAHFLTSIPSLYENNVVEYQTLVSVLIVSQIVHFFCNHLLCIPQIFNNASILLVKLIEHLFALLNILLKIFQICQVHIHFELFA